jgi:hypothetical protein
MLICEETIFTSSFSSDLENGLFAALKFLASFTGFTFSGLDSSISSFIDSVSGSCAGSGVG